ncbi:MAG: OmpH family outer membrane protein [Bacteroidota bacterium]
MKKVLFSLMLMLTTTFTLSAQRIAYVDMTQILESIEEYTEAQRELDQLAARWREEIAKEYDQIKSLYNRYQAEQVLLSDEARRQKEDEILAKETNVRELQKARFGPEGQLFKRRQELVRPIQDKVFAAIEDYADDRGFDFIFDQASGAAGMIFASPKYDKTEDIINKLK